MAYMPKRGQPYNVIYQGTYPDIRHLPIEERFLWIYLLTCDEHRSEGLFALDVWAASKNCSMDPSSIEDTLAAWSVQGKLDFDPDQSVLWFPNAIRYYPSKNSNTAKGVVARISKFKNHYASLLLYGSAELFDDTFLMEELRPYCLALVSKGVAIPQPIRERFPDQSEPWQ